MFIKTTACLAFAAACLTTIATMPADAQTAGAYSGPQSHQSGTSPYWSPGISGSTSPNYTPQINQGDLTPSPTDSDVTVVVAPPPRIDPGDLDWDARRNLVEARQYERLVETDLGFREARIRRECGPITDPQLHADCVASFDAYEPPVASSASSRQVASTSRHHQQVASTSRHHQYVGSSTAPRQYRSEYGR
jgi:hypothetical protein